MYVCTCSTELVYKTMVLVVNGVFAFFLNRVKFEFGG